MIICIHWITCFYYVVLQNDYQAIIDQLEARKDEMVPNIDYILSEDGVIKPVF